MSAPQDEEKDETPDQIPEQFMFESEGVILDPSILMFAQQQQRAQVGGCGCRRLGHGAAEDPGHAEQVLESLWEDMQLLGCELDFYVLTSVLRMLFLTRRAAPAAPRR